MKFATPWITYRLFWMPVTSKIFDILTDKYSDAAEAASSIAYVNVMIGFSALATSMMYNEQLPAGFMPQW